MSTKNSQLLSFVEKSNSTCKSRASKISIEVVLVSIFGTMYVYDDVTKGHTQAVFLVPTWCKTLKLEQTLTILILCLGGSCYCLQTLPSSLSGADRLPSSHYQSPVCIHGHQEDKSCSAKKQGAKLVSLYHPRYTCPPETVSSNI